MFKKVTEEIYTDVGEEESYTKDSFRRVNMTAQLQ
jgi:hypothetical protein